MEKIEFHFFDCAYIKILFIRYLLDNYSYKL